MNAIALITFLILTFVVNDARLGRRQRNYEPRFRALTHLMPTIYAK